MSHFIIKEGICWDCHKEAVIVIPSRYHDGTDANGSGICGECLRYFLDGGNCSG